MVGQAIELLGGLDILVNNAGVYEFLPLENVTAEHFHRQFNLNVLGLLLSTQEAVKQFGPGGGSVINISSVAATAAPPQASVYSATKAAVDAVRQWRFTPTLLNGQPVPVVMTVTVNFSLQ